VAGRRPSAGQPLSAYQQALGLLARREHSRCELGRKLKAKGLSGDDIAPALDALGRQDFLNDQRYAQAKVRQRAGSGHGPLRIRGELAAQGLDRVATEAALASEPSDWDAMARALVQRRYGNKDLGDPATRRKAVDFLLRRGFDQKTARAAIAGCAGPVDEEGFDG
jgi:regulatory protein